MGFDGVGGTFRGDLGGNFGGDLGGIFGEEEGRGGRFVGGDFSWGGGGGGGREGRG